ncbi:MAG: ABC transporter permease [Butyrivibrio sp.]|nr:ABC transporter permease [Butyrivibrio sp.]
MKNPLNKRHLRELKNDFGKYLALFLFLVATTGFVSGFDVASSSMIKAYNDGFTKYNIEDGHFILREKATDGLINAIKKEDTSLYELYYKNKALSNGHTLRIYKNRNDVNLPCLMEGSLPQKETEIAIDRLYAENNDINIGDIIEVDSIKFTICGFVSLSDYTALFKNNNDTMFDANKFSIALVTDKAFENLSNIGLYYCYAYKFDAELNDQDASDKSEEILDVLIKNVSGMDTDEMKEQGEDMATLLSMMLMLTSDDNSDIEGTVKDAVKYYLGDDGIIEDFVARQDNQAINFTGDDFGSDQVFMNYLLYIVIVVIAFIFSITSKNTIEHESNVIGTLRASGFTKQELIIHYMTMPIIITLAAALIGNLFGYSIMKNIAAAMYYHSYSLPTYVTIWNSKAFILTTIVPGLIVIAVNLYVITKAMQHSPLSFLRGEIKNNNRKRVANLPNWKFLTRFRTRIIIQNKSAYFTLILGIFLSVVLLMFGMLFNPLLDHYKETVLESQIADYQYILKEEANTSIEGAEKYAFTALLNEADEEISVYGIEDNSIYLSSITLPENENGIILSSAYREKYGLAVGDTIHLKEEYGTNNYIFEIEGFYDYEANLTAYISRINFASIFDEEDDFYNGYFSNKELTDIHEESIATTITASDLTVTTDQLKDSMGELFYLFYVFAMFLFVLVIYLLAKMIVEKNAKSVSIMKILGYKSSEINSLYNTSTAIVTIFSLLISMPLSNLLIAQIWKIMILEFKGWLPYYLQPVIYIKIFIAGLLCYLIVHIMQMHKISKIPMSDALKSVE